MQMFEKFRAQARLSLRVTRALENVIHDRHRRIMARAKVILGWFARACGLSFEHFAVFGGTCTVRVRRADGSVEEVGAFNVVTTVGKEALVDAFQGGFTLSNFHYHHLGTGTTAAAAGDTALETPLSEARANGSQTENGSTTYRTVGSITATGARPVTEAGLFSASSAGTMFARVVFAVVNLAVGDALETTWDVAVS